MAQTAAHKYRVSLHPRCCACYLDQLSWVLKILCFWENLTKKFRHQPALGRHDPYNALHQICNPRSEEIEVPFLAARETQDQDLHSWSEALTVQSLILFPDNCEKSLGKYQLWDIAQASSCSMTVNRWTAPVAGIVWRNRRKIQTREWSGYVSVEFPE